MECELMAHVITAACIDVKDGACVDCCPVDCIYEGERTLYIHPDECIDCCICASICPTQAIFAKERVPADQLAFVDFNRQFFETAVSGLGSPGGASISGPQNCDHPQISQWPVMPA
jgi:NAD-dependent dihydropyrimidine dehydrogenase PreA subunit